MIGFVGASLNDVPDFARVFSAIYVRIMLPLSNLPAQYSHLIKHLGELSGQLLVSCSWTVTAPQNVSPKMFEARWKIGALYKYCAGQGARS